MATKTPRILTLAWLLLLFACINQGYDPWSTMSVYCRRLNYNVRVQRQGCTTERFPVNACLGLCKSYVKLEMVIPHFNNQCMCCKSTGIERKTFQFAQCNQGVDKNVQIDSATGCACQHVPCS